MPFKKHIYGYMKIHFVGCNGVSMRALARLAESRGHIVTGSDSALNGHDEKNVYGADLVVYTNAVKDDNCELVYAKNHGIPVIERAEYLGEISKTYRTVIAVSGCHGKSTTAAMLGRAFSPRGGTVHVGVAGGSRVGRDDYFITEACEYRAGFLHLSPDIGVVLNVQFDHPDFYKNEDEVFSAYKSFCARCKKTIVNGDDEACVRLSDSPVTFGLNEKNDYRAVNVTNDYGRRSFTLTGKRRARVELSAVGEHNVYNALAAIAAASECGLSMTEILPAVSGFTGISRRFERKGIAFGKTVLTDYAHHPAEIDATIRTAREMFPSVAVVFQPHTYTRTRALMDEFARSLAAADTVILAPVFSAREKPIFGVTSQALCVKTAQLNRRAYCFDCPSEIIDKCKSLREKALIFMGAGDINTYADMFISADTGFK